MRDSKYFISQNYEKITIHKYIFLCEITAFVNEEKKICTDEFTTFTCVHCTVPSTNTGYRAEPDTPEVSLRFLESMTL